MGKLKSNHDRIPETRNTTKIYTTFDINYPRLTACEVHFLKSSWACKTKWSSSHSSRYVSGRARLFFEAAKYIGFLHSSDTGQPHWAASQSSYSNCKNTQKYLFCSYHVAPETRNIKKRWMYKSWAFSQSYCSWKHKRQTLEKRGEKQIVRMELGQPGILSNVKIKIRFLHKMIKMKGVGEICLRPKTTKIGSHIKWLKWCDLNDPVKSIGVPPLQTRYPLANYSKVNTLNHRWWVNL